MNARLNTILSIVLFSGLGLFSYLLLVNFTNLSIIAGGAYSIGTPLFFIVAFNILGYSTMAFSAWINDQYAVHITRRWKIATIYAMVTLMLFLLNYGLSVIAKFIVGIDNPFVFHDGGMRLLIVVWLVELVILGLLIANKSIQHAMNLQKEASQLQEENNKARYTALQNQLNPHFLFNSLNTLIAEIEYEPKTAVIFTRNLSNVYRYVLQCQNVPLVTLSEELEFVTSYLFLHEVRLGNCIKYNTDIPQDYYESQLPPLTLQLLVENVIKHNSITVNRPISIDITIEEGDLVVSNSVNLRKNVEPSGVGLKNLAVRCRLILGREITILSKDDIFSVKIPLLYE